MGKLRGKHGYCNPNNHFPAANVPLDRINSIITSNSRPTSCRSKTDISLSHSIPSFLSHQLLLEPPWTNEGSKFPFYLITSCCKVPLVVELPAVFSIISENQPKPVQTTMDSSFHIQPHMNHIYILYQVYHNPIESIKVPFKSNQNSRCFPFSHQHPI